MGGENKFTAVSVVAAAPAVTATEKDAAQAPPVTGTPIVDIRGSTGAACSSSSSVKRMGALGCMEYAAMYIPAARRAKRLFISDSLRMKSWAGVVMAAKVLGLVGVLGVCCWTKSGQRDLDCLIDSGATFPTTREDPRASGSLGKGAHFPATPPKMR